jgi:hypothetical protein
MEPAEPFRMTHAADGKHGNACSAGALRYDRGERRGAAQPRAGRVILGLAGAHNRVYTDGFRCLPFRQTDEPMLSIGNPEFHSPQREAALFYGLFLRGHSIEALREQIDVSPKVFRKWMRSREFDPDFREGLRQMYTYRKQVLAIFDALVTSEQTASERWQ